MLKYFDKKKTTEQNKNKQYSEEWTLHKENREHWKMFWN